MSGWEWMNKKFLGADCEGDWCRRIAQPRNSRAIWATWWDPTSQNLNKNKVIWRSKWEGIKDGEWRPALPLPPLLTHGVLSPDSMSIWTLSKRKRRTITSHFTCSKSQGSSSPCQAQAQAEETDHGGRCSQCWTWLHSHQRGSSAA